jgi:signal transduction histidine kinase
VRPWLKWLGFGALVSILAWAVAWAVATLGGGSSSPWWLALGVVALIPAAASIASPRVARLADPALVAVLAAYCLAGVVAAALLVSLLVAGRVPDADATRPFVGPVVVAVLLASLISLMFGSRMLRGIRRGVYGRSSSPADLARSFGTRMTRAVPLEELALQGAEALRSALSLQRVELWIPAGDELRPWLGDPPIQRGFMSMKGVEPRAVVQAGLIGHGWMSVWLPELLAGREDAFVRAAPMAHAGELLGLLLVERSVQGSAFAPDEERTVVEMARQLGLAVYNARLDSALQASLDQVRRQAEELQASRGRIVAASDAARRQIERNLHDGAQQRIVALAVKARLARQLIERDPQKASLALEELGGDIDGALQELRDLAHGIYPPLLADKGLTEALTAVARRASMPVTVNAGDLGRPGPDVEATAYFCCLEAIQNAGKYAGDGTRVAIDLRREADALVFVVSDDGAGFEVRGRAMGAGFNNMNDRLGSLGGTLRVESAPGRGTRITGVVPVTGDPPP